MHSKLHTKEYYQKVHRLLKDLNTKEEVVDILKDIGEVLSSGGSL